MDYIQVELIKNLLSSAEEDEKKRNVDSKQEMFDGDVNSSPASIVPPRALTTSDFETTSNNAIDQVIIDKNAIWSDEEVPEVSIPLIFSDNSDGRERPDYEIVYKQNVSANDAYLGIDFEKDPSSACSDSMEVRILLPKETSINSINLDVTSFSVGLTSENYKLYLSLPNVVYEKSAEAKWDIRSHTLSLLLPINSDR